MDFLKKGVFSAGVLKALSLALFMAFVSCESDDDPVIVKDKGDFVNGVFVLNQGAMNAANASVSFIAQDTVMGNLFAERNGAVLGDVLQDMVSVDTLSFLVLNNSHSLMVVNNKNFNYVGQISEGINNPRYAAVYDGLIYVSQWGNGGEVAVVDPEQMQVVSSINVGVGPEGLEVVGDELWVANCGGYATDNIISVIDPVNDEVIKEITVNDNPQDLIVDADGDVWVLATGRSEYDAVSGSFVSVSPAAIHHINASSYDVEQTFLPDEVIYGKATKIALAADGQSFYFGGGYGFPGIWEVDITASELPQETFADVTPSGLGVNPANGDLYVGVAPNFTAAGRVEIYSANGTAVETYEDNIGIGPCNFVFVSE
ncbi:YVTN family beta-propeller protein [Marinilabilia salmonicolor]|uniref:YVTN family beta-propeller protein n=2 Tax=Marinilabilia salmonicolor TaxID=989 RepID=A0A2T0XDL2_9BACT|nr:YVTN family beta-propeller protein [Marinilabilia salmonicolor]RCW32681.1 YVTN family beta-propeller protein [Marinilabilia salmonicolor]